MVIFRLLSVIISTIIIIAGSIEMYKEEDKLDRNHGLLLIIWGTLLVILSRL